MRILISNDDGIRAKGIESLTQKLQDGHEIIVVAPLEERSATGHSLSLNHPLRVAKIADNTYGCNGFPADCVLIGLKYFFQQSSRPDLIISGINCGPNLSQDMYYSGTVAAAREAAIRQIPGIAVSLTVSLIGDREKTHHFDTASQFISRFLEMGGDKLIPSMAILNINVPNLPFTEIKGVALTKPGFLEYSEEIEERIDLKGRPYYWIAGTRQKLGQKGTDSYAVYQGLVSLSLLGIVEITPTYDNTAWNQLISKLNQEF